jgi:geranylgeranyl diphosphate synthase type I
VRTTPVDAPVRAALDDVRARVDDALLEFLEDRRAELAALDPDAAVLVEEIRRLADAGGRRVRPILCVSAFRAVGSGDDIVAVRAGVGLELLHTFALIHDDVMDGSAARRGVETTHRRFAREAPPGVDPDAFGRSVAILVGDLAAVLAERAVRTCGAEPARLEIALGRFDRMRVEMAAGQLLDLRSPGGAAAERIAALKTSSYTAEGPVAIGLALAGAPAAVEGPLRVYARSLGQAFQLRDDVDDGDADPTEAPRIDELLDRAVDALEAAPLAAGAGAAFRAVAALVRPGPA